MRLLLFALLCLAADSARAQGPFTPPGVAPPDYVVTMDTKWADRKPGKKIILHHGNWTRVTENEDAPGTYYLANESWTIWVSDPYVSLTRHPASIPSTDYAPRNTSERQIRRDESCTVWEVSRTKGTDTINSSCITDDGIELWWKSTNSLSVSSGEVTRIERRSVSPDDVRPPPSIFALEWPDTLPGIPQAKPDHEVVMERAIGDRGTAVRTVRRHGAWQSTEEIFGKQRSIDITHDFGRIYWRYASDDSGAPERLTIGKTYMLTAAEQAEIRAAISQPVDENRIDMVLGETCRWFNTTQGADATASACLTEDGIMLKETSRIGAGHLREWKAIRVTRRSISINEIKPPAELLSPQTWGVE